MVCQNSKAALLRTTVSALHQSILFLTVQLLALCACAHKTVALQQVYTAFDIYPCTRDICASTALYSATLSDVTKFVMSNIHCVKISSVA